MFPRPVTRPCSICGGELVTVVAIDRSHADQDGNLNTCVSFLRAERDKYRTTIEGLKDALRWCGGSQDFQPEGQAYEGWKKIVEESDLYPTGNEQEAHIG